MRSSLKITENKFSIFFYCIIIQWVIRKFKIINLIFLNNKFINISLITKNNVSHSIFQISTHQIECWIYVWFNKFLDQLDIFTSFDSPPKKSPWIGTISKSSIFWNWTNPTKSKSKSNYLITKRKQQFII